MQYYSCLNSAPASLVMHMHVAVVSCVPAARHRRRHRAKRVSTPRRTRRAMIGNAYSQVVSLLRP